MRWSEQLVVAGFLGELQRAAGNRQGRGAAVPVALPLLAVEERRRGAARVALRLDDRPRRPAERAVPAPASFSISIDQQQLDVAANGPASARRRWPRPCPATGSLPVEQQDRRGLDRPTPLGSPVPYRAAVAIAATNSSAAAAGAPRARAARAASGSARRPRGRGPVGPARDAGRGPRGRARTRRSERANGAARRGREAVGGGGKQRMSELDRVVVDADEAGRLGGPKRRRDRRSEHRFEQGDVRLRRPQMPRTVRRGSPARARPADRPAARSTRFRSAAVRPAPDRAIASPGQARARRTGCRRTSHGFAGAFGGWTRARSGCAGAGAWPRD